MGKRPFFRNIAREVLPCRNKTHPQLAIRAGLQRHGGVKTCRNTAGGKRVTVHRRAAFRQPSKVLDRVSACRA